MEERDGAASTVRATGGDNDAGLLRIDFPGYSDKDRLEATSWEELFQKFDEKKLAFLYQDETNAGEEIRFFRLISRETAEDKDHKSTGKP